MGHQQVGSHDKNSKNNEKTGVHHDIRGLRQEVSFFPSRSHGFGWDANSILGLRNQGSFAVESGSVLLRKRESEAVSLRNRESEREMKIGKGVREKERKTKEEENESRERNRDK